MLYNWEKYPTYQTERSTGIETEGKDDLRDRNERMDFLWEYWISMIVGFHPFQELIHTQGSGIFDPRPGDARK
jgi:hypothetical protein